ncbi:hypothetical protein HXA34_08980 [Salipaludibacillus agaradhaerens]|uniref:Membrane protein YqhR n=2 Tax=Salipaludibacillus agaradhaerens TaxID=76935 RepID=A0A9Q4B1M9_SALAG|nr:hypothetical protein [Salipaludibacillus agaradhaerens]MCR6106412.1 hypothetical protein [Salipaludibacillus agaradhaerens]MCR6113759.1 hypothetical protein [Salipaludibacillus agaradhaerens]MCR6118445.1 hypothetical protein [Salipaludibacillus agaradhaerens]UJW57547.1 hypothetical protein HXZ66_09105 [Bacillus sp. A116_S68]
MKMDKKNKHSKQSDSFSSTTAMIGFVGGLFWGFIGYVAYLLNFVSFGPSFLLMPWALGTWKYTQTGQWIGILFIGILSIGIAFIYRALFAKVNKFWPGLVYGGILWVLTFVLLYPLYEHAENVVKFDVNSNVTSLSLFVLYGLFIGYSISYEYHEQMLENEQTIQE